MTRFIAAVLILSSLGGLLAACAPGRNGDPRIGTVWTLVSLDGAPLVPGTTITAEFRPGGKIGGTSGCNSYNASYDLRGSSITIGPVMGTLMACPEPIMSQEQAYVGLLQRAARFAIEGDSLVLTTSSAAELVFEVGG